MSPATLTDATQDVLADLPPYMADEPYVQAVVHAIVSEFRRIEAKGQEILDYFHPNRAIEPYLSYWEAFLGLPVKPNIDAATPYPVSDIERRSRIVAAVRRAGAGSGAAWVTAIDTVVGGSPWSYEEGPSTYAVTLEIPYASGTYSAVQAAVLARKVTPAHLDISPTTGAGFLIGISLIGQETL